MPTVEHNQSRCYWRWMIVENGV